MWAGRQVPKAGMSSCSRQGATGRHRLVRDITLNLGITRQYLFSILACFAGRLTGGTWLSVPIARSPNRACARASLWVASQWARPCRKFRATQRQTDRQRGLLGGGGTATGEQPAWVEDQFRCVAFSFDQPRLAGRASVGHCNDAVRA